MNGKYEYSDKIQTRRRSLFRNENFEKSSKLSESSDEMYTLDVSDNECSATNIMYDENIRSISSTKLINNILSTPRSKRELLIEDSMSPLYLSPLKEHNSVVPQITPTKFLKTPNDCTNSHPETIPKLSRKSDHLPLNDHSQESSSSPTSIQSKCSKVRTSLFPEFDVSPRKFYPKIESLGNQKNSRIPNLKKSTLGARNMKKRQRSIRSKRISGQINAGVTHKIKKPKEKSTHGNKLNISTTNLAKIKTFKPDIVVTSELNGFLEDLDELNRAKEHKLIQIVPQKRVLDDNIDEDVITNHKRTKLSSTRNEEEFESIELSQNVNEIIDFLDNSKENITKSLLSPTSEISNMASELKIDSPKKVKNLTQLIDNDDQNEKRYFPIFYPNFKPEIESKNDSETDKEPKKKKLKITPDQLLLDAGQKRFGITQCTECDYVYHINDPSDEKLHDEYHNGTRILQFHGWKNERVVEKFLNGDRIIEIHPGDPNTWISKVRNVLDFINRDLKFFDVVLDISKVKVFLYISHRTIAGCLVAENKTKGHKIIQTGVPDVDICSEEEYPIKCGVLRLWVSLRHRRKGIATKLMNTLKLCFIPDAILTNSDIAVSSPTDDGKLFAIKYFKTENFLTYFN